MCPSINVMAAHVAARTRRLRIGLAVSLAAFYNPLRLAEEVALIDVLSGGRVVHTGPAADFLDSDLVHRHLGVSTDQEAA